MTWPADDLNTDPRPTHEQPMTNHQSLAAAEELVNHPLLCGIAPCKWDSIERTEFIRFIDRHMAEVFAENERLRKALERFAEQECCRDSHPQQYRDGNCDHCIAREALKGATDE